jgi:hypothetical protein
MPGDSRTIQFQIHNTGSQAVRILNIVTTQDDISTGLRVQWPDDILESANLSNYVLLPETTSESFLIHINWDASAINVPSGQFRYFGFTLDYQDATLPIPTAHLISTPNKEILL